MGIKNEQGIVSLNDEVIGPVEEHTANRMFILAQIINSIFGEYDLCRAVQGRDFLKELPQNRPVIGFSVTKRTEIFDIQG